MKAGIVTVLALAASASAQVRRGERHHRHVHPKRDQAVETHVEYVTATAPHAVVYVDGNGKPISTAYDGSPAPAATPYKAPAPAPEKEESSSAPAPAPYSAPAPAPYSAPAPAPKPETTSSAPAEQPKPASSSAPAAPSYSSGSGSGDSGSGRGITYSPYVAGGGCKSQDQVKSDIEKISGYDLIRLYGVDCEQVTNVLAAAKPKGIKLFVGIFDVTNAGKEAQTLIDAVNGDWSSIDTVSVGNEWVNGGKGSADQVVSAINSVRGQLKSAGYSGNVVTVDTFVAMIANPSLCEASDYAAANCHAFFDGGKTAQEAGSFVKDQAERVKQACGGKRTVITESGWPWQGETNGAAVPSRENQQAALSGLKENFDKDIILYTAFDDMWKSDFAGSFNCEKYWGFLQ
ncbi:glycoside hydrolase family 17 protein [Zasmidium cellare ATCC 36951]|uniref:Glycoside hydrolase family 17 protein n=1 Tax=Zasmidium cellare ATCC 36951 TaxID=1080233 RepID=A0A6A6CR33_ZASCE|nr:glycoside hydrolase family 17 protein [Zasmidium cellare ATCC 36951]KAF2169624.1 glycoside hydrolase family 17 protein [Zasmidium cellare ATCC 36951]